MTLGRVIKTRIPTANMGNRCTTTPLGVVFFHYVIVAANLLIGKMRQHFSKPVHTNQLPSEQL